MPQQDLDLVPSPDGLLPDRYVLSEIDGTEFISCRESPNLLVRLERGLVLSESAARKAEPGTIFLDGAAETGPFLDADRQVYNLDHHSDCVRPFTLSTCEQVYVLIRRGFNLHRREWKIYANEPDLDTVLSIWLLLNHTRIREGESDFRKKILPLVRLEGVIDVHGLELTELACLPDDQLEMARRQLTGLMQREVELKKQGEWVDADPTEYTLTILREIDKLVYSPWDFEGFEIVDELARVNLTGNQVAVVCRSDSGIYEVEQHLRAVYGERLGIIVLQSAESTYTLRQVNLFLPGNLQRIYARLNLIDPLVRKSNRWGGSDSIGGSPRRSGTGLTPRQISEAVVRAFRPASFKALVYSALTAVLAVAVAVTAAWVGGQLLGEGSGAPIATLLLVTLLFLLISARQYPRVYGLKAPVGRDWLYLMPVGLLGGLMGGAWSIQAEPVTDPASNGWFSIWTSALVAELLFRSLVHGILSEELRSQRRGGHWFLSWPVVGSTLLYSLVSLSGLFFLAGPALSLWPDSWSWTPGVDPGHLIGTVLFGFSCGIARERSESIIPPAVFHCLMVLILRVAV